MFSYEICNVFDKDIFAKQCAAIEQRIPNITNSNAIEDVDGSQLRVYTVSQEGKIKVKNSIDFGISIESDVDIEKYFV